MTAVDRAELKRLAEGATPGPWQNGIDDLEGVVAPQNPGLGNVVCIPPKRSMYSSLEAWPDNAAFIAAANPAVVLALLSEIEGLKAERDALSSRNVEAARLAYDWMVAHDSLKAGHPYDLPPPSRTQAPDSWRPDRCDVEEAIHAWLRAYMGPVTRGSMTPPVRDALVDAILALRPQTAESGK